jgi:hypothetical protein
MSDLEHAAQALEAVRRGVYEDLPTFYDQEQAEYLETRDALERAESRWRDQSAQAADSALKRAAGLLPGQPAQARALLEEELRRPYDDPERRKLEQAIAAISG